jgi:dipeptidase E
VKLYLSSYRLGREPDRLRRLVERGDRAGTILNACDVFEDRTRVYAREVEDLRSLGFDAEELDLRDYFHGAEDLRWRLAGLELMDDPGALPAGYSETMPATTLGWVPWRLVPHWRSDHPEAARAELAVDRLDAAGLEYRALTDGDAIVVDESEASPPAGAERA